MSTQHDDAALTHETGFNWLALDDLADELEAGVETPEATEAPPEAADEAGDGLPAEPWAPDEAAEAPPYTYEEIYSAPLDETLPPEFREALAAGEAAPPPAPAEPESPRPHVPDVDGYDPLQMDDRVVIKLLFDQVVQQPHVEAAWHRWKKMQREGSRIELWRVLADEPELNREAIYKEAATIYGFKTIAVAPPDVKQFIEAVRSHFDKEQWVRLERLNVLPIGKVKSGEGKAVRWIVATHDPLRPEVGRLLRDLQFGHYEVRYASESAIGELIEKVRLSKNEFLERVAEDDNAYDLGMSYESEEVQLVDEDALEAEISRSKLINLFEAMLVEAVRRGVSDVHIFPNDQRQVEIHFRLDGDLECWHVESRIHPEAFLAVVKDNSINVDRFEREAAQDGFIQRHVDGALIRFRVSVLPIASAVQEIRSESIVIRVLDDRKVIADLAKLGLQPRALEKFTQAINQPYGMVILTGPTGSGKTTTLYAALQQVVSPRRNVLTVEDPVEYILPGVRQIKLNRKLDLEGALRSILRHDPDVVMVGEMRDRQTAELAIKLANTGHLTFSTLHTNDAPSAVSRLYKMGVEPFLISYAINLIVAQRLIKKLCPKCKQPDENPEPLMMEQLGFKAKDLKNNTIFTAGDDPNCPVCRGVGYKGRRAITETLPFSKEIRRLILASSEMIDEEAVRQAAIKEGMLTLQDSARYIVLNGETSVREMMHVVFSDV